MNQENDTKNELDLAKLLNENNSLEGSYLKQLYQHIRKDRPIQIWNIFAEVEQETFNTDNLMNIDFLNDKIRQYYDDFTSTQDEINQLSFKVENLRQNLRKIICNIDSYRIHDENPLFIGNPDENCSKDVERLAREVAKSIVGVDENQLIQYLARGPAKKSEEYILEKTKALCEKRYQLKQLKVTKKILKRLNDRIVTLQESENKWEQEINPNNSNNFELLSNAFDDAASNISQISSGDPINDDSDLDQKWRELQKMSEEIKGVRDQLFNTVKSETEIPLPKEFTLPDKEKEALIQTRDSLIESNKLLTEYLQKIREHGIVDSTIFSPEEVRNILNVYNELKQRNNI